MALELQFKMKSKPWFHYSFVSWGSIIVAECCSAYGELRRIAISALEVLPSDQNLFSFSRGGYTFNYLTERGFTYLVVASEGTGGPIPFEFLMRVKVEFQRIQGRRVNTWSTDKLDKEFGALLKVQMDLCAEHPQEIRSITMRSEDTEARSFSMNDIDQIVDERYDKNVDAVPTRTREVYGGPKRRRRRMKNEIVMIALFMALLLGIWLIHNLAE